ncbi:DUF2254 domain-containing protein [Allocoleopsis franciscana]|uniref:Putative membrane protein n=1 Tax=Allocoleopsis franciscana PCC 7113 TaxID=1173027 RepID=K9WKH8_9CYAN|nr:DUF2254 domain-containing protein [Allocoleopsis franciscana]AFZ20316.1 putative membrane protein [Allocoleopsis franciscana PCC 7113]
MKKVKLQRLWDSLHSSYWFVPTLMAAVAVALAFTMLTLDRMGKIGPLEKWGWIYTGGPDGARAVLSAVVGSMVSVTATSFSIAIVALQLASSNFGPRLLRNFMQDTGNQIVLGTFISTFIYGLLVLRTVRGEDYDIFVPEISITVGILLALISIGVLIYFIDHASTIIQASHIISEVSTDLHRAIERLFPEKIGHSVSQAKHQVGDIPASFDSEACLIQATGRGYLQAINEEELMKLACKHDLLLYVKPRPGKFVIQGTDLVRVLPEERVDRKLAEQIEKAFILGKERTEQQDIEFPIDQLVEIALRALSPGINDPFTAIRCIDRLSAGLSRLAQRDFPSPYRYDEDDHLRVIANPVTFPQLTNTAFNQIRRYGKRDVAVTIRLLEAIARIAPYTSNKKDQAALLRHAQMIERGSREEVAEECDRACVEERYWAVVKALERSEVKSQKSKVKSDGEY